MSADENDVGELPAEDKAYFESRGEKLPEKVEKSNEEKAETPAETETDELLDEEAPKEDKKVPLRALTKEREEGKKSRLALQELEKRHAVLEDRWNTILQLNQQPEVKADEDPEPDPNQDIFAHNAWLKRQVEKVNKTVADRDQSDKAAKDEAQREAAVWNLWGEASKAEVAETPDYQDAVKWMSETRTKQLAAMKAFQPQFQSQAGIDQQINNELKQIVIAAAQQGISPAKVVYNMAKEWGYAGKPTDDPKPEDGAIDKLSKNLDAETSLSGAGGSRPGGSTTPKDIANMSPEQFEAWYDKHGAAGFKKLQTRGTA